MSHQFDLSGRLAVVIGGTGVLCSSVAAAHLIHGSTEGRFRVTYCTDPSAGGLTRDEVEGVGYQWQHLDDAVAQLGLSSATDRGTQRAPDGSSFEYIPNPALGLWKAT